MEKAGLKKKKKRKKNVEAVKSELEGKVEGTLRERRGLSYVPSTLVTSLKRRRAYQLHNTIRNPSDGTAPCFSHRIGWSQGGRFTLQSDNFSVYATTLATNTAPVFYYTWLLSRPALDSSNKR